MVARAHSKENASAWLLVRCDVEDSSAATGSLVSFAELECQLSSRQEELCKWNGHKKVTA